MNDKGSELYRILDNVVKSCTIELEGVVTATKEDVLGKSRLENVVMTRCILVHQIISAGYTTTTAAILLHRTPHAVRHLLELADNYMKTSRAYRIANAEATILCRDIGK